MLMREAERLNTRYQMVIGKKEVIVQVITVNFGSTVTGSMLRTANGSDYKSVNDWTVEQLFEVRVVSVRTQTRIGKPRRHKFIEGRTRNWKKAIVKLHDEDRIAFF